MNLVLLDVDAIRNQLKPLTWTRAISDIRIGILTIKEKWEVLVGTNVYVHTEPYLMYKYQHAPPTECLFVSAHLLPSSDLLEAFMQLKKGQKLISESQLLGYYGTSDEKLDSCSAVVYKKEVHSITRVWDIFKKNGTEIEYDFTLLTKNRTSCPIPPSVQVIGDTNKIFIEPGATLSCAILNTQTGPIYIGREAEIMEGSVVRGPLALCEHSALKLSTKIYGPTTIGPHSKVGGEVNNSVIFGYSNKAHDGFLGNSVIGEWCNLGADTNNSNLKNNYANVKIHDYVTGKGIDSGLQFCGLIMGDHSKSGINTMFNTGTVVGVGCNVFGGGFPPQFIPDFSWCDATSLSPYQLDKLFETAEKVWERRGLVFDESEKNMLSHIQHQATSN